MTSRRTKPGAPSLLCEACGYELGASVDRGACPECGRAVADSQPERRTGSAWQRRPGIAGWRRTLAGLARSPERFWDTVAVERRRSRSLLLVNVFLAFAIAALAVAIPPWTPYRRPPDGLLWAAGLAAAILAMTWIEHRGVRFFGAKRGWRVTGPVATAVCGHASYGWLLAALGSGLAARWSVPLASWLVFRRDGPAIESLVVLRPVGIEPEAILTALGVAPGLLLFETLVFLGVRRMRFANPPGAGG